MTCAKLHVECAIYTRQGQMFLGSNACDEPQTSCPRVGDEGYEKCASICKQKGHAEDMALMAAMDAGANLDGATAVLRGHTYFCRACQEHLFQAGIKYLQIDKRPFGSK